MAFLSSFFSDFVKRRSLKFWVAFSLSVTVLLVKFGEWLYISRMESNWDSILHDKTQTIISSVQNSFQTYQRETHQTAKRIAAIPEVSQSISAKHDQRKLFSILERAIIAPDMNVEIYNRHSELLAWWGTTAGLQHAEIDVQRETSFVSAGAVFSYLTGVVPVLHEQEVIGSVVVHRLFDVNYPISNRFISSAAFTQTFPRRLEYTASFSFSDQLYNGNKAKATEIPLQGIKGNVVGYAFVDALTPSAIVEQVHNVTNSISRIFLVIVSIIMFIVLVRVIQRSPQFAVRLLGVSTVIWLLRYSWIWLDFPSGLISGGIFDPRFFASPFGFGIAKSIGELFITSTALLVNTLYIAFQILPRLMKYEREEILARSSLRVRNVVLSLLIPLLAIVLFLFHRGFTAVVRSAVFDSTLQYSDPTSVLPSFELAAILLNLFFIAIAFAIASVLLIVGAYRIISLWFENHFKQIAIAAIIFLVIGFLFGILHPNPLVDHLTRILVAFGTFTVAAIIYHRYAVNGSLAFDKSAVRFSNVALLVVAAITIVVFQLDDQTHQRERRNIELLGTELTRPVDAWMTNVLEQTLRDIRGDQSVEALVSHDRDKLQSLAFTLWSKSLLSRVGYNCGVYVYDVEEHLVSNFRIGIRQSELSSLSPSASVKSSSTTHMHIVEQEGSLGKRKTYVGSTAIVNSEGIPIGSVEVGISAAEHLFFTSDMPPILQTYEREETERYLRSLVIFEFVNGNLVYTTGEDIPHHVQLSEEALKRIQAAGTLWIDETIGDSEYETYYVRLDSLSNENMVLALGWRKADWRWRLFDFLRHVLFYLMVCAGLTVLIFGLLVIGGYSVALSFRAKLFLAFFIVSLIPLLLIAYYNREITIERANQSIVDRLTLETALTRNRLLREFQSNYFSSNQLVHRVNDEWCESVAAEIGTDFSIYVDAVKKASSKSELFQAEILDSRLSANAFFNITLEGKNFFAENRMIGNYDYLVGYRPLLPSTDKREFAILAVPLLYSQVEIAQDLARRNILLFGAYAVVIILTVIVGTVFANKISSPIRQLIAATQRIARGELDFRLPASRKDEIGELHQAFNTMTEDLKQNRESLIKAERELAWREMAKQVAHEIKNPLTPMKLSIQHLRQAFHDKDKNLPQLLEQVTKTIIDQIDALSRIASQFAHFARMPERREEDVNIQEVVSEAIQLFDEHKDIKITFIHPSEPMIVRADREELRRAFINIIRNAVQAMSEKGSITITAEADQTSYRISISDSGPGIPHDILPRLFEPNFSTKSEGMGLGLAIVRETIDDLQGQIDIQSEIGRGTTVRIVLAKKHIIL